jgi:hypothetical protein
MGVVPGVGAGVVIVVLIAVTMTTVCVEIVEEKPLAK